MPVLISYRSLQFACLDVSCTSTLATPRGRRLHLIDKHKYPPNSYFPIRNKGIGGLHKKWGEGATLLRKGYTPNKKDTETMDGGHGGPPHPPMKTTTVTILSCPGPNLPLDTTLQRHSCSPCLLLLLGSRRLVSTLRPTPTVSTPLFSNQDLRQMLIHWPILRLR